MLIILRSVGGFTGPAGAEVRTVETNQLPAGEAASLIDLIRACDFFSLPSSFLKSAPQSWDFVETLQIDDDGRAHTIRFHLDAAPDSLKALVDALKDRFEPS